MPDSYEEVEERGQSAFEEWAERHPHLSNAIASFTGGALTSIAVVAAGEPPGTIVLAAAAVSVTIFLFCELFTRLLGRPVLGGGRGARGSDAPGDPETASWFDRVFGGSDGDGGGGGGGGDGGGG